MPTRRELLAAMPGLAGVPLCCKTPVAPPGSYSFTETELVVDAAQIAAPGLAVAVVEPERKLNLLVVRVEGERFAAIDRTCTHGGAMCTYNERHRTVQCTSLNHAEYALDGTLLHGRTHGNLRAYRVRVESGRVRIHLGGAA